MNITLKKYLLISEVSIDTIHNVINNAGIASMNSSMLSPLKITKMIFDVNFFGTFILCREGAKSMLKTNYGRIINFTSVSVPLNLEGEAIYSASKSAVSTLTSILAKELAGYNITVNAVGPNPVKTSLLKGVPQEKIDRLISNQPIKRYGKFRDISNVIDFYLKPESNFITGQTLYLGGVS